MSSLSRAHSGHTLVFFNMKVKLLSPSSKRIGCDPHTLGGVGHLRNDAQMTRRPCGALLAATEVGRSLSLSVGRYALRTMKILLHSGPQVRMSSPNLGKAFIFRISWTSTGRKNRRSKSPRHAPCSSRSLPTRRSRHRPWGEIDGCPT